MYSLWKSYGKIIAVNDMMHWGEKILHLLKGV